jgi:hypothetical protein
VKRQSLLPVSFRKGHRERQKAGASYVTLHEATEMAQSRLRRLLLPMGPIQQGRLLTTQEAAAVLAISPATLRWWRTRWARVPGPDYVLVGSRPRYSLQALHRYLSRRIVRGQSRVLRKGKREPANDR